MFGTEDLAVLAAPSIAHMVHSSIDQSVGDSLLKMTVRVGAAAYVRQNEAVLARDDLLPILATTCVPANVVVGGADMKIPLACSEELSNGIANSKLYVIPQCGHLPPIERPAVVAELIRNWLRDS